MIVSTDAWRSHVAHVLTSSNEHVNPRGMPTLEIIGPSVSIDMETPIVLCKIRKLNYGFMFGEASWILDGSNDLLAIEPYMNRIKYYSDNSRILSGAYGPHIVRQLQYVCRTLRHDRDSRQAVISIWQERPETSKDIPCTLTMQFIIRNDHIHCIVNMRSSDVYLGLPYDLFTFSCVAARVRDMLGIRKLKLGTLSVHAGSAHVYKRDFAKAVNSCMNVNNPKLYPEPQKFDVPPHGFDINARHGILAELARVIEAGNYGNS